MRKQVRNKLIWIGILVMIGMINACKITQPYHQPNDAVSSKLFRDSSNNDSAKNIANISWKEMFTDTLLQSLIREGINNNLDLKVAVARIKAAAANFKQSKLALLPNVDVNPTATFQRVPSTQYGFPEAYLLQVTTSWEADVWGKLSSAKRAALASLLQSEAYQKAVQTQLVSDIVTNYYSLLAFEAQLRITERT